MKRVFFYFLTFLFLGMFLFSGYKIVSYLIGNYENKKIQKAIKDKIEIIQPTSDDEVQKNTYQIDFDALKKENPDTVAYLEVRGTAEC